MKKKEDEEEEEEETSSSSEETESETEEESENEAHPAGTTASTPPSTTAQDRQRNESAMARTDIGPLLARSAEARRGSKEDSPTTRQVYFLPDTLFRAFLLTSNIARHETAGPIRGDSTIRWRIFSRDLFLPFVAVRILRGKGIFPPVSSIFPIFLFDSGNRESIRRG